MSARHTYDELLDMMSSCQFACCMYVCVCTVYLSQYISMIELVIIPDRAVTLLINSGLFLFLFLWRERMKQFCLDFVKIQVLLSCAHYDVHLCGKKWKCLVSLMRYQNSKSVDPYAYCLQCRHPMDTIMDAVQWWYPYIGDNCKSTSTSRHL